MSKAIYLDMDGTVYDLYNKPNWLKDLREENPNVFSDNNLIMCDKDELTKICGELMEKGYTINICSWTPMQASPEYCEVCRAEKISWINDNMPYINEINIAPYGMPKQLMVQHKSKKMYLIDDNAEVCEMWATAKQRTAINVNETFDILQALHRINTNV